jgi:hypothetical protein
MGLVVKARGVGLIAHVGSSPARIHFDGYIEYNQKGDIGMCDVKWKKEEKKGCLVMCWTKLPKNDGKSTETI